MWPLICSGAVPIIRRKINVNINLTETLRLGRKLYKVESNKENKQSITPHIMCEIQTLPGHWRVQ